ncbi:MAG: DUF2092 domain-containing protein [Rhizobiaceae bacterium]
MKIIQKMSSDFGNEKRVSIKTTSLYDEPFEGKFIKSRVLHETEILRPNRLVTRALFDDGSIWLMNYDGTILRIFNVAENEYTELEFSGDLNGLADFLDDNGLSVTPLVDYIRTDFAMAVEEIGGEITMLDGYVEPDHPNMKTYHVLFEDPGTDWQLWLSEGEKTLPIRLLLEYDGFGRPEYLVTFDEWKFGDSAGDISSKIEIPNDLDNWRRVEFENPIDFGAATNN